MQPPRHPGDPSLDEPAPMSRAVWVVVPAFNEGESIPALFSALEAVQGESFGCSLRMIAVVVDDGSGDGTFDSIRSAAAGLGDSPGFAVVALRLSRNFGQQAAIQAGLEYAFARSAGADWFVVMDSDLQHPPALVPKIVRQLETGTDHVQMLRRDPARLPWFKRVSSALFYSGFRRLSGIPMPAGSSDFRGMSRRFLEAYLQLGERSRFNRGLFSWIGFETAFLTYDAPLRQHGSTKYTLGRMLSFAGVGLVQFSSKPLVILCSGVVLLSFGTCLAYLVFEIARYLRGARIALGWPSLMFLITFWSGAISLVQLLLAVYLARIFEEIKHRPVYLVRDAWEQREREAGKGRAAGS
jgi:glycosyltransferase involved in cell wall biosynthesis